MNTSEGMMMIEMDTATGGPWEWIGKLIKSRGKEDSSGLRRTLMETLIDDDYEAFNRRVPVPKNVFNTIRDAIKEIRSDD